MKFFIFFVVVMTSALIVTTCFAEATQSPSDTNSLVTLSDYLRYSALHNAGLKSSFQQFKAAVEAVPQAEALPDPKITYPYLIEEVETRVGPQRQKFGIMQTFPWFGKIEARTDAAAATAKAAKKRYEAAKLKLFYRVKEAFYEYAYLGSAIEISRQNLEVLQHFEEVARTKYMAAVGSHPDVIEAQIELAALEDKLQSFERMAEPVVAKLNALLNRESNLPLPWPEEQKFVPQEVHRQKVIARLRTNNPELAALDFDLAAIRGRMVLARKKFYPDIGVGLDWIQTDDARRSRTSGSGRDPIIAMISINLPIWTDSYRAAHRQARAKMRDLSAQKVQKENDIVAQAMKALYEFEDNGRKVALYADTLIPKAKEMLATSKVAYQAGTIDFLSLIDAQRTLLDFELLYERAGTSYLQRLGELEMLAGGELGQPAGEAMNE